MSEDVNPNETDVCGACGQGRHIDCSGWCFCKCEYNAPMTGAFFDTSTHEIVPKKSIASDHDAEVTAMKHDIELLVARNAQLETELATCKGRRDGLDDAFHQLLEWARAYPLAVFPEPDFAKAAEALKAAGMPFAKETICGCSQRKNRRQKSRN